MIPDLQSIPRVYRLAIGLFGFFILSFLVFSSLNKADRQSFIWGEEQLRKAIVAEYELAGGFVGFCDVLTLYSDGSGIYQNKCNQTMDTFQLAANTMDELQSLTDYLSPVVISSGENVTEDGLKTTLKFHGQGKAEATEEQKIHLTDLFNSLLITHRLK